MNYRGLASIAVLSTAVLGATVVLFDVIKLNHTDNEPTFSMAPLSLGNPASAATLRTRNLAGNLVVDEEDAPLLPAITIPEPIVKTVHVKSGATLSGLLTGAGIERVEAARIVTTFSEAFNPRKIRAGQNLDLFFMPSDDDSPDRRNEGGLLDRADPWNGIRLFRWSGVI